MVTLEKRNSPFRLADFSQLKFISLLAWTILLIGFVGAAAGWQTEGNKNYQHQSRHNNPIPSDIASNAYPVSGSRSKNLTTSVYSHASRYGSSDLRDLKKSGERTTPTPGGVSNPPDTATDGNATMDGQQPLCAEEGTCPYSGVDLEVMKSMNLAKIRQDILRMLKLDENRLPNISAKNFPMADYLSEIVEIQGDSPKDEYEDDEASTETIFAFSKIQQVKVTAKETKQVFFFSFSDQLANMRIENAVLYVQVNMSVPPSPHFGMHHRRHHHNKFTNFTIRIMQRVPQKKGESAMQIDYGYFKPFLRTTSADDPQDEDPEHRHEQWIMIDVRDEIPKWVAASSASSKKIGLIIEAISPDKEISKDVDILFNPEQDILSANSVNNNPFIKVNLKEKTRSRHTREVGMICEENSPEKRCCRYPLTVDFEVFGWDFIIAPRRYEANYCSGECPPAFMQAYVHNHIVQQALPSGVGGPCCAARKLSGISLLYYENEETIICRTLPGMIVDRCGCT